MFQPSELRCEVAVAATMTRSLRSPHSAVMQLSWIRVARPKPIQEKSWRWTMPKDRTEFVEENTQRAVYAANLSTQWLIADHNLSQGRAAVETMLMLTRKLFGGFGQQTSTVSERSLDLIEQAFSNAFDAGQKMVHVKDPQELAQIQSEFVSQQTRLLAEQTQHLGQSLTREVGEMASAVPKAVEMPRKKSEAA
jgi:Phasin protein